MKNLLLISTTSLFLSGCVFTSLMQEPVPTPAAWTSSATDVSQVDPATLHGWWKGFNDPALDQLIDIALKGSPDRKIAEGRVLEARGLRAAARSSLLPQISATGNAGRGDENTGQTGNFYEAGFDASYELDLFGRNRNTSKAASENLRARTEDYQNVSLTLVADVARNYIEFRAAQKQVAIAQKNLDAQQKTLDLVKQQKELGEAPQLDVERAEGLVNTTKSAIPEFSRQADNARLRLSVLTGLMPEAVTPIVQSSDTPVIASIKPALLTPAQIISNRPDIRAAQHDLEAETSLRKAEIANLFPTISLSAFFGVADSVLINPMQGVVTGVGSGRVASGLWPGSRRH